MSFAHNNDGVEKFLKYVTSIGPGKDIVGGRRGSEANVTIKFVVPLLEYLGFDKVGDLDFEVDGMDVRLSSHGDPCLVVECKAWEELLTDHLNQCLEYTLMSSVPHILITSGRSSALYSSLLNHADLGQTESILKFGYTKLKGAREKEILHRLHQLVTKESFARGAKELKREVESRLPQGRSSEAARETFFAKCSGFKTKKKTHHMMKEEFREKANTHPPRVAQALMRLLEELERIGARSENVHLRYRSKDIGLEYELNMKPRPKKVGMFGVYPGSAHVAFGLEGWERLGVSKATLDTLRNSKTLRRHVASVEQAERLVQLLRKALSEVEKRQRIK